MSSIAKAITAFITPLIVGLLLPLGITGDTSLSTAIEIILMALLTALAVYAVPNQTK